MAGPRHGRPLGLALGGGSARGYAHIGVLKVLERADVRPDLITGTSIGAVFGAVAATGYTAEDIERLFGELSARQILWMVRPHPTKTGMFDLRGLMSVLGDLLPSDFADLAIPFACVSTDLLTGRPVVHLEGDLLTAIRATVSIPLAFEPVRDDGRLLVDGGLVEPVPVATARLLGARSVVAVTLNVVSRRPFASEGRRRSRKKTATLGDALPEPARRWQIAATAADITERRLAELALADADVVIAPKIEDFTQMSFMDASPLIALGEAAAQEMLPAIRALLH